MADRKQDATKATQAHPSPRPRSCDHLSRKHPSPSSHPSHETPEAAPRAAATTRRPGLFRKGGRA